MRLVHAVLLVLLLGCQTTGAGAEETEDATDPWAGCWARKYDAAHLAKHPGQLVTAMTVAIDPRTPAGETDPGAYAARVAATLRGKAESYTTLDPARCGPVGASGETLRCFLDGFFLGQFSLERAGKNIKLVMQGVGDGVVLVPGVDLSAFIRLSPQNPEHAVFLLNPMPPSACGD